MTPGLHRWLVKNVQKESPWRKPGPERNEMTEVLRDVLAALKVRRQERCLLNIAQQVVLRHRIEKEKKQ